MNKVLEIIETNKILETAEIINKMKKILEIIEMKNLAETNKIVNLKEGN